MCYSKKYVLHVFFEIISGFLQGLKKFIYKLFNNHHIVRITTCNSIEASDVFTIAVH